MSQVTSSNKAQVTLPSDEEILIVREFDAPKHLVYKAYTTPELVRRWWAGERGEMETCEIDLRVGGKWRYAMVAKGGFPVAFHGEFSEIVENERLVTTEVYEGAPPGLEDPINIVTFEESGGTHHADDRDARREPRGARHDHRLRHGGWHSGGHGPARAGRPRARLRRRTRRPRKRPPGCARCV